MADESWRWWPAGYEAVRVLARSGSGTAETAQIVVPSRAAVERVPPGTSRRSGPGRGVPRSWSGGQRHVAP